LYEGAVQSGRKSIALKDIEEKADKVPTLSGIPDFLNAL
ncbi:Holliday junction resolvase RecU, partial [Listeria monocytogenes]|nr:Holliday junction resolvase RecU [Listeria monocytogenes]